MLILFANPSSGRGKGAKVLSIIETYLNRNHVEYLSISTNTLKQSLISLTQTLIENPEAKIIAIANGLSYGGGMKVCPAGLHITHPAVSILQGRSIQINANAVAYADGERIGELPLDLSISHNRLKVLR